MCWATKKFPEFDHSTNRVSLNHSFVASRKDRPEGLTPECEGKLLNINIKTMKNPTYRSEGFSPNDLKIAPFTVFITTLFAVDYRRI